jgi:hypothetical protein
MKKKILKLLEELNENTYYWWKITYYHDGTGLISNTFDKLLFNFDSEKELTQKLKDRIKELNNK